MEPADRETEIGGPGRSFQSTLWSVILKAKEVDGPDRREALQKLATAYWKPLYNFVRRRGNGAEESKDIIQGFFASLLERNTLQYLDRARGKFRTFLLTTLEHYMADEYDRSAAQKRGGGRTILSLDFATSEGEALPCPVAGETADQAFVREWAVGILTQALDDVRREYQEAGQVAEFDAFRPHLTAFRPADASYDDLAAALGIRPDDVRNRVRAARAKYRESILARIRSYTASAEEAAEELRQLLGAFS